MVYGKEEKKKKNGLWLENEQPSLPAEGARQPGERDTSVCRRRLGRSSAPLWQGWEAPVISESARVMASVIGKSARVIRKPALRSQLHLLFGKAEACDQTISCRAWRALDTLDTFSCLSCCIPFGFMSSAG